MRNLRSVSLKRVRRETWTMRYRLLGIAAILGMAVGIYVGIHSAIGCLFATRDRYYHSQHMEDVEIRFVPEDLANVPDFTGMPGVAAWQARLLAPGRLELADGGRFPTEVVAQSVPNTTVNALAVLSGRPLSASHPEEVLIDRNFAEYHHVKVGDRLSLKMGNASYALTVRGIALSPEYLVAPANPNVFLPLKGSMGVIYTPLQMVSRRLGFSLVDSLIFRLKPGAQADAALLESLKQRAQSTLSVLETRPRALQLGHMFMNVDLGAFSIFVPAVVVIFLLAALVVGFFLIYRWVQAQRETLGVFLALGYRRRRLLAVELYPVALIAAAALLISAPAALVVLKDFAGTYSAAVGLPAPRLNIDPVIALHGIIALLAIVLAMAAWPLTSVLRLLPATAIRGGRSSETRRWGGSRSRRLQSLRHHPRILFPVRNVLRGRRIGAMTVIAVALAIGVSISYFAAADSFNTAVAKSYIADRWNVAVDFLVPVWNDELGAFRKEHNIRRMEEVLQGPARLEANGRSQPARISSYTPGDTMRRPALSSGILPAASDGGIVLEHKLAESLGLQVGDYLHLVRENRVYKVRVAGIFSGAIPGTAYAPLVDVQRWMDMPNQLTGLLLDMRAPTTAALAALTRLPHVGAVTPKTSLVAKVKEISREAVTVIYLAAAFSITVSMIILIASGTFTVSERKEQYTTLRTLGFDDGMVGQLILTELCLLGLFGAVLAVPFGYGMSLYLVGRLSQAWFHVTFHLTWLDVLLPTLPLLVLLPVSALAPIRSVVKTPLAEAIKQRRYG
jgi:putative ABC transport system permease protein